jgi:hypothetical protein
VRGLYLRFCGWGIYSLKRECIGSDAIGRMEVTSIIAEATAAINNHFQAAQATRFILGRESGLRTFLKNKDKLHFKIYKKL